MLHKKLLPCLLITLFIFVSNTFTNLHAQCTASLNQYPPQTLTPTTTWQSSATDMWAGEYALFNVVSGTTYEFSLCPEDGGVSTYDSQITLFNNANPAVPIGYSDDFCGVNAKISWAATFTGLLRVQVNQYNCLTNQINTTLRFRISSGGGGGAPSNDNCSGVTTLSIGLNESCVLTSGTLTGATQSLPATTCAGFNNNDVWFNAFPVQPTMIVGIAPTSLTAILIAEVFIGPNCNALQLIGCVTAPAPGDQLGFSITDLLPGDVVYWRVFEAGITPINPGTFQTCAFYPSAGGGAPANNLCANATTINAGSSCVPVSSTLQGATPQSPTTTCGGTNNGDVWFQVFPTDTAVTIQLTPNGTMDGVMEIFVGTCGNLTLIGCVDATVSSEAETIIVTGFTPGLGESVYVRVYDWNATVAANPSFTFCAFWNPPATQNNDECINAIPLTAGVTCNPTSGSTLNATASTPTSSCSPGGSAAQDVWFSFVAPSSGAIITVNPVGMFDPVIQLFSGTCNNLVSLACSDFFIEGNEESLSASNLVTGQTYFIRVYDYSGIGALANDFTICVRNYPSSPNNECAGAIPITVAENAIYQPFTTAQATQSLAGCVGNANDDVWFSFVAGQNPPGTIISVGGDLGFRTVFQLFSGTCGNLTPVACVNDVTTGTYDIETRQFNDLTAGQTYYLRVYDFTATNSNHTFYLAIQGTPAAGCNIPPPTVSATSTTICAGGSVLLSSASVVGLTYQWFNGGVPIGGATSFTYTATQTGSYTLQITDAQNCTGLSAPVVISPGTGPSVQIAPAGTSTICTGSSIILSATAGVGFAYQWLQNGNPIGGATSQTYTASQSGNYTVIVTDASGCSTTSAAVTVNSVAGPNASITAAGSTNICPGTPVVLNASPVAGATYQWQLNGQNIGGATSLSYSATQVGNYTIVVTTSACSSTSNSIAITATQAPDVTVSVSGALSFCQGQNVTLSIPQASGTTYQWFNGANPIAGSTQNSLVVTASGSYTVTATSNGCAVTSVATVVTVSTPPTATITAGGNTSVCEGSSVLLNANTGQGFTYQWNFNGAPVSGATAASFTANQSGNYSVTISSGPNCSNTSSNVSVTVIAAPVVSITANGSLNICQGSSVNLSVSNTVGLTFQWFLNGATIGGATSSAFAANAAGSYTVAATNTSGCATTSQPVVVNVNALPNATITANGPTTFCVGGNVLLQASSGAGYSYQWMNAGNPIAGAINNVLNVNQTGTYSVMVTDLNQCTAISSTLPINVAGTQATITFTGAPAICDGNNVILNATSGVGLTYQWFNNGNAISGATQASLTVTTGGNYTVSVTDQNNCTSTSAPQLISVGQTPAAPNISNNGISTFCEGENVSFSTDPVAGINYQWLLNGEPIAGATNPNYNASVAGGYAVRASNASNCQAISSTLTISQLPSPTASINTGGSTTICAGETLLLTASSTIAGSTFQWTQNGANIPGATNATHNVNASGMYAVIATAPNGCSGASSAVDVVVNAGPNVSLTLPIELLCIDQAQLNLSGGTPSGGEYSGSGVSGSVFTPITAGVGTHVITYAFTDNNGCQGSANAQITVDECTSVRDLENAWFSLYPNPAKDILILAFEDGLQLKELSIFDVSGRKVHASVTTPMSGRAVISVSDLAPGSYVVRASIGGKLLTSRFIIAH